LSADPGASLTDPRAVPPEAKAFAEKIKGGDEVTFKESIGMIDEHYIYFENPFKCGDVSSAPNENVDSAKVFSFGLMTGMDEEATLRLFGEIARELNPTCSDHQNIRNFKKLGWGAVSFESGLCIISKLQSFDDTESAMATQTLVDTEGWDFDSDNFIP
jgi:hypothetical protein